MLELLLEFWSPPLLLTIQNSLSYFLQQHQPATIPWLLGAPLETIILPVELLATSHQSKLVEPIIVAAYSFTTSIESIHCYFFFLFFTKLLTVSFSLP